MDVSKLKAVDLKKELKARGLSTSGTKNELAFRLQEALHAVDADSGDNSAVDNDDLLDEEAVLADESEILEESNGNVTVNEDDAALLTPTSTIPPKTIGNILNNQPSATKKVILNRKTAVVVPTAKTAQPAENPTTKDSGNSSDSDSKEGRKIIKLGSLTPQERLKLHARKFGAPVSDSAKKVARGERFGLVPSSQEKSATDEKLQKRKERFGIVAGDENEIKKQKRAERFGLQVPAAQVEEIEEKKRQRAQRFGSI